METGQIGAWLGLGLLLGTVSLVGGHGVTIAWSPSFVDEFEIANAMEIGLAASTIGLILASLSGGPVASYLIKKHSLQPAPSRRGLALGRCARVHCKGSRGT